MEKYFTKEGLQVLAQQSGLMVVMLERLLEMSDTFVPLKNRMAVAIRLIDECEEHRGRLQELHNAFKNLSNRITDRVERAG